MKRRTSLSALRLVRRRERATARTTAIDACRNIRCRRRWITPPLRRKESSTERFVVRVRRSGREVSRSSAASRPALSHSGASSKESDNWRARVPANDAMGIPGERGWTRGTPRSRPRKPRALALTSLRRRGRARALAPEAAPRVPSAPAGQRDVVLRALAHAADLLEQVVDVLRALGE